MAKVQTRRTISVSRALLERWQAFCAGKAPVSALTEFVIEQRLAAEWTEQDAAALIAWLGGRVYVAHQPVAARIARLKLHEAKSAHPGQRICHTCFEPGHGTLTCPTIERKPTLAEQAARLVDTDGLSLGEAGARFGITGEAVRLGWVKLFGDRLTPKMEAQSAARTERETRIDDALRDGMTVDEVRAATGEPPRRIRSAARRIDIAAVTDSDLRFERGMALVSEGKTYAQAAADVGVSEGRLGDLCRAEGIRSTGRPGRDPGRGPRAAELVRSGECCIAEAARRERVSTAAVAAAIRRGARRQ
jgi:hypothetical protein